MGSMRVSARLDDATASKLARLQRDTGLNVSEIVRKAIDCYYTSVRTNVFAKVGFLGCADGPEGLSDNYKLLLRSPTKNKV